MQFIEIKLPQDDFLFKNRIQTDFLWGAAQWTVCATSSQSQELWDQLRRVSCPLPLCLAPNLSTRWSAFCITNPWFTVNQIHNLLNDYSRHTYPSVGAIKDESKVLGFFRLGPTFNTVTGHVSSKQKQKHIQGLNRLFISICYKQGWVFGK